MKGGISMTEEKIYADDYSCSFGDPESFIDFLADRKESSRWMTAPSKKLHFEAIEKGTPAANQIMQIHMNDGKAEIIADTMANTAVLLSVNGEQIPVRSCAVKTILERARISGYALSKVETTVFAQILNYCMNVASGDSLIKVADEKVSAVHGGDEKDYRVLDMQVMFRKVKDYLDERFPGNHFVTGHFDHAFAIGIWRLDGQADQLLKTYRQELAAKGIDNTGIKPALRFMTSDVGMSGANLYPTLMVGSSNRLVPLGYPLKTEHKGKADMDYFDEQLNLLYARYEEALDRQMKLLNIDIVHSATALLGVLKRIGAPKKASYEALEYFKVQHGDTPCTAYELYLYMTEVIFSAQCEGASAARVAQLEEIVSRALSVNWHEYDRPGEFVW